MNKVKFFALLLMVTFVVMGTGYAAWTDSLEVNATLTTGWLDVKLDNAVSNDAAGVDDPEQYYDVANTEATVDGETKKILQVDITNAYPGYHSEVKFDIKNDSTMPVKVKEILIDGDEQVDVDYSEITNLIGQEIAIGGTLTEVVIENMVKDTAEQEKQYTYTITIIFQQWNIE